MSSEIYGNVTIAPAVVTAQAVLGVVAGAGWLAWSAGKLIIGVNQAVNDSIEQKKREIEAAAQHRKTVAIAAHDHLVDVCKHVLLECEKEYMKNTISILDFEKIKMDINTICITSLPDDVSLIEGINSRDYLVLEKIVQKKTKLLHITSTNVNSGQYSGLALADLMEDMRINFASVDIVAMAANDVHSVEPKVLERAKLNKEFSEVVSRIIVALEHVNVLEKGSGLTTANSNWFQSCFNGVDAQIKELCNPTISNEYYKRGISRLKAIMEQYDMVIPNIDKDYQKMAALYALYVDAAKALNEPYYKIKKFESPAEIEIKLDELKERAERAQVCAEIYNKLGPIAYLCFAMDQELKELGYSVHSRKNIIEKIQHEPQRATAGEDKLPFYQWDDTSLTQLYSIASQCSLQVIVHDDGTISMQAISEDENEKNIQGVQKKHCESLKLLYENLKKNWFISYENKIISSEEKVTSFEEWMTSDDNPWIQKLTKTSTNVAKRRKKEKEVKYFEQT